jgi:hypothetical protein
MKYEVLKQASSELLAEIDSLQKRIASTDVAAAFSEAEVSGNGAVPTIVIRALDDTCLQLLNDIRALRDIISIAETLDWGQSKCNTQL